MNDVTAAERIAIIRDLIDKLPMNIPDVVVTGPSSRETFEIKKAKFVGVLDRIKHHIDQMKPWDAH